jgi:hypothetical protein
VPFGRRRPVKVFFVDKDARRGDDLLADEHVVPPLGIARAAEKGANPAARAEARLVLVTSTPQQNTTSTYPLIPHREFPTVVTD